MHISLQEKQLIELSITARYLSIVVVVVVVVVVVEAVVVEAVVVLV